MSRLKALDICSACSSPTDGAPLEARFAQIYRELDAWQSRRPGRRYDLR